MATAPVGFFTAESAAVTNRRGPGNRTETFGEPTGLQFGLRRSAFAPAVDTAGCGPSNVIERPLGPPLYATAAFPRNSAITLRA